MQYKITYRGEFEVTVMADSEQEAIEKALVACDWDIKSVLEEEYIDVERE